MDRNHTIRPLPRNQRYAGFFAVFWLWAAGNVLLTNFISGSEYALGLGFWSMLIITVTGFMLGLALSSWDSQRSARYGIDEMVSLRPTYGYRGSSYGVLVLVGVNFGWVGILASMSGTAMTNMLEGVNSAYRFSGDQQIYALTVGIILPLLIVMYSQKAAFVLSRITVPILLLFVLYIIATLVGHNEISAVIANRGDGTIGWAGAFEIIFAFSISWFPYLG